MKPIFLDPPLEEAPYCWFVVVGSKKIGVHKDFGWCMQIKEQVFFFDSEESCMPLLPILEVDSKVFFDFLKKYENIFPSYLDAIRQFPKGFLFDCVFRNAVSGYWPEKVLEWLAHDISVVPFFEVQLRRLVQNK